MTLVRYLHVLSLYYVYQQEKNPIEDKEFTDCCKLKHGMTQLWAIKTLSITLH